jgi:hypothetical protein
MSGSGIAMPKWALADFGALDEANIDVALE